jgi:molybdenum cofactor biosynthesis protein B
MDPSHIQNISIIAGIITVSTSRSGKEDISGSVINELLTKSNIPVSYSIIVPDIISEIRKRVIQALETCNCIIVTGGTGITSDDCTIEAISPLFDKTLDGFGELFRMKSLAEVGTRVILSRAVAGIIGRKVVFCIPGSPNAAALATRDIIIPEITHILTHAAR